MGHEDDDYDDDVTRMRFKLCDSSLYMLTCMNSYGCLIDTENYICIICLICRIYTPRFALKWVWNWSKLSKTELDDDLAASHMSVLMGILEHRLCCLCLHGDDGMWYTAVYPLLSFTHTHTYMQNTWKYFRISKIQPLNFKTNKLVTVLLHKMLFVKFSIFWNTSRSTVHDIRQHEMKWVCNLTLSAFGHEIMNQWFLVIMWLYASKAYSLLMSKLFKGILYRNSHENLMKHYSCVGMFCALSMNYTCCAVRVCSKISL